MKHCLIFFGGSSPEHDISILSARNVVDALDAALFLPILVWIAPSGHWYFLEKNHLNNLHSSHDEWLKRPLCYVRKIGDQCFLYVDEHDFCLHIDVAFPLIHGATGEDGVIQGFLELMGICYVGSGVAASALCMDKDLMKKILMHHHIPCLAYECVEDLSPSYAQLCDKLKTHTLFIKPASLGSSIGISKATNPQEYDQSIRHALSYGKKAIVEPALSHFRELECAVMGNDRPKACPILGEIMVGGGGDPYSYDAKYVSNDAASLVVPARVSDDILNDMLSVAVQAFCFLGCRSMARVDFFLVDDQKIYVNEINTIPGFTNISMYPKLWQTSGMRYSDLITNLIQLAIETKKNH
jgi:D-alanine-D-alanine ligase